MKRTFALICASSLWICCTSGLRAQEARKTNPTVPRLVKFTGALSETGGKPLSGVVGVTFALYEEERGGAPLWMETQNVQADASGRYTALLGATRNDGIPAEMFASGQGRWLGVQPEGQAERARVLMVSVPYALKAVDAETLGGLPPSAFALANASIPAHAPVAPAGATKPAGAAPDVVPNLTGTGVANHLAYWTNGTTISSSALYQTAAKKIGLGTTTPGGALEVDSATATAIVGHATATSGSFNGVNGQTASTGGYGVSGIATATSGNTYGVYGESDSPKGTGVFGSNHAASGFAVGVNGVTGSPNGTGVFGNNLATTGGNGVQGQSNGTSGNGVFGSNTATSGFAVGVNGQTASPNGTGVNGLNLSTSGGNGVQGQSNATSGFANGVSGASFSTSGNGVFGSNSATSGFAVGVNGQTASPGGTGVNGVNFAATGGNGVQGQSNATSGYSNGVWGQSASTNGNGVSGNATATSGFAIGVQGSTASSGGAGVFGWNSAASGGLGLDGQAGTNGVAVFGVNQTCTSSGCTLVKGTGGQFVTGAGGLVVQGFGGSYGNQVFYVDASGNGFLAGNLNVTGKVTKGSGSFKIDHPLDPESKYLSHSFVESPDMMDVYNGVVRLDAKGQAWVELPDYFEALNGDFRYQLTAIGAPAPHLYVAREVSHNRFQIGGGRPGGRVSWQVTGIRHDAYANAHRVPVTEEKPPAEQGHYLHPDVYGRPKSGQSATLQPGSPGQ